MHEWLLSNNEVIQAASTISHKEFGLCWLGEVEITVFPEPSLGTQL